MDRLGEKFLNILRAALDGVTLSHLENTTQEQWQQLFRLAETHHVLPLICEGVCRIPEVKKGDVPAFSAAKREVFRQVMLQVRKTNDFLSLLHHLQAAGITPLVVKGIICRSLYPQPDHRPSSDEDVLIPAEQFDRCHEALLAFGMEAMGSLDASEVPYRKPGSPLFIELHKQLFPPESQAYGSWNRFFDGAFHRSRQEEIYGTPVRTLGCTDHLFYLICHCFKHFLHSGCGIRQICDIVLYANKYGSLIHWERILELCREIRADKFTAALLKIGEKHLLLDPAAACLPECWRGMDVDEGPLLEDLLSGGVYGGATMSRRHSSTMTLEAVSAKGRKTAPAVFGALFPPASAMERRYPWLKKHPWLLPAAWLRRMATYARETRNAPGNSAAEAVKIGNRRIALLRKYDIIG